MKRGLITLWLLVPASLAGWHLFAGQRYLAADRAGQAIESGITASHGENWQAAADSYHEALANLSDDDLARRRELQLAAAQAAIRSGQLVEGQQTLVALLDELPPREQEHEFAARVRHELGFASYYTAWLMRLEGATADEWKPEAERARQQFRYLAEAAEAAGGDDLTAQKNLESAVRLEQMDLSELMARPLPKNCPPCPRGLCNRKRRQCRNNGNRQNPGDCRAAQHETQDARKELRQIRSAGFGSLEGEGS